MNDMNEQRTAAWLYERVGFCTASKFAAVMDVTKKGTESAKRRNYRVQLAVERLTNEPTQNYVSAAMQHGTDTEPLARMAYEARTGAVVEETGFIHHPAIEWVGGSPDGLIGSDGGMEIKCPFEAAVHVETLMNGSVPEEHLPQIQGLMWITGRKWWDFASYDPRMPKGLQLYVQRVVRDEKYIAGLAAGVEQFLGEVSAQHQALMRLADECEAAAAAPARVRSAGAALPPPDDQS